MWKPIQLSNILLWIIRACLTSQFYNLTSGLKVEYTCRVVNHRPLNNSQLPSIKMVDKQRRIPYLSHINLRTPRLIVKLNQAYRMVVNCQSWAVSHILIAATTKSNNPENRDQCWLERPQINSQRLSRMTKTRSYKSTYKLSSSIISNKNSLCQNQMQTSWRTISKHSERSNSQTNQTPP